MRLSLDLGSDRYVARVDGADVREFPFMDDASRRHARDRAVAFGEGWSEACRKISREAMDAALVQLKP